MITTALPPSRPPPPCTFATLIIIARSRVRGGIRNFPGDEHGNVRPLAANISAARQGIGVHCGECGCFHKTPHAVFLAWFRDVLAILTEHNIGYALWNFRGSFGLLDSGRSDVAYEEFHGHKLDRKLLQLLQEF